jgi:hypothetical protein
MFDKGSLGSDNSIPPPADARWKETRRREAMATMTHPEHGRRGLGAFFANLAGVGPAATLAQAGGQNPGARSGRRSHPISLGAAPERRKNVAIRKTIVLASVFASVLATTEVEAQIIHRYSGDSNASDTAGTNPGAFENGATAGTPGKVGGAFLFDGIDDGVNLGNVPDLDYGPSSSFTWEAWVNSFGPTSQSVQYVLATNYACTPTAQVLQIFNSGVDAGKAAFAVRDANDVASSVITPFPLSFNAWHHLTAVREVTPGGKFIHLYVDCVLVASAPDITTETLASNASDFIGRRFLCPDASTFNGLIDEVRFYNRALTPEEASQESCVIDTDSDGIADGDDNCPTTPNSNQADADGDGVGDPCDNDNDGDSVPDGVDNCPLVWNANQGDFDGDGLGDACETDDDNDGVLDAADACPGTLPGEMVNSDGCSIAALCPCENSWKSHGAYVSCVSHAAGAFAAAGLITETQKGAIISDAGLSNCGNKK